jgi:haloacetate dehalogenase
MSKAQLTYRKDDQMTPSDIPNSGISRRNLLAIAGIGGVVSTIGLPTDGKAQAAPESLDGKYFLGFKQQTLETPDATINFLVGGQGPAVLLLHGYPQNHLAWRKVAPVLAKRFTVVVPDLRGYGSSSKPEGGLNHVNYSKRNMALDQIAVLDHLGIKSAIVAGHDRGARVGQRLAMDHPELVSKLVLLDTIPTDYSYHNVNSTFGTYYWHWFFLIQNAPFPETVLGDHIPTFMEKTLGANHGTFVEPDVYADYIRCFEDRKTFHAVCEDYRAGATIDMEHAVADGGRKITCPVTVAWGTKALFGHSYDVVSIWRDYAEKVSGVALNCGHWAAEEVPEDVAGQIAAL